MKINSSCIKIYLDNNVKTYLITLFLVEKENKRRILMDFMICEFRNSGKFIFAFTVQCKLFILSGI